MATGVLLYTPGVKVIVACSASGHILDLSDDIESGNMTLNENNPHSLNLTLANANGKYGGIFTPNDKVIVQMKRLTWLQTFSGYLDTVPYFQVFPGSINLSATCTMKRLKYHYWDPGYLDVIDFIASAYNDGFGAGGTGKTPSTVLGPNGAPISVPSGDILSNQGLTSQTDNGMKSVLVNILTQIIGWDQSKIHIGGIPTAWLQKLQPIWNDLQIAVTNDILSASAQASASALGTGVTLGGVNVGSGTQWTATAWVSAVIQMVSGSVNTSTVSGMLHWLACENNAPWWGTGANIYDPLNENPGTGGYASLMDAATAAATNLLTYGNGKTYAPIVALLQQSNMSLSDFATAVNNSPWCDGGYGGASKIESSGIQFAQTLAPVAAGPPQSTAGSGSTYLSSGTGGDSTAQAPYSIAGATTLAFSGAASTAGTGTTTGPPQAPGASLAVAYAIANAANETVKGVNEDCSLFVQSAWKAGGVSIPRTSETQYTADNIVLVPVTEIMAGDILFADFGYYSPPGHVGLYVGNNQVIQHDPPATMSLSDWITSAEGEAGKVSGGGFYGVGRVISGTQVNTNSLSNPQTVSVSASQISAGASGNGTAGLASDANGSLIYGSGYWDPQDAGYDPNAAAFTGAKALMLDTKIMPYITDVVNASMRNYCSAPNGDFMAWFPDHFGQYGYAATWHLSLIELVDFTIEWSDENLVTHQYVAGSSSTENDSLNPESGGSSTEQDEITSYGVATIDMPGLLEALTGINPTDGGIYANVNSIYQQFGARVNMTQMPTVYAPSLAAFWFAVKLFQDNWANQFSCDVSMTFMPELWPGMLLAIDELQFQCYIHSVTHSWNLQDGSGFQTSVNVMAPSTTGSGATGAASANSTGGLLGLARSGPTVS